MPKKLWLRLRPTRPRPSAAMPPAKLKPKQLVAADKSAKGGATGTKAKVTPRTKEKDGSGKGSKLSTPNQTPKGPESSSVDVASAASSAPGHDSTVQELREQLAILEARAADNEARAAAAEDALRAHAASLSPVPESAAEAPSSSQDEELRQSRARAEAAETRAAEAEAKLAQQVERCTKLQAELDRAMGLTVTLKPLAGASQEAAQQAKQQAGEGTSNSATGLNPASRTPGADKPSDALAPADSVPSHAASAVPHAADASAPAQAQGPALAAYRVVIELGEGAEDGMSIAEALQVSVMPAEVS